MTEDNTVLLVLADKRADYGLISKVLKTAGYAGYPNFRFAVLNR
jgi:biopolymer transport protein ExbD